MTLLYTPCMAKQSTHSNQKRVLVSVTLTPQQYEEISAIAAEDERKVSTYLRYLALVELRRRKTSAA